MIRLGVCAPLERMEAAADAGFDYIEGNLTELARLSEANWQAVLARFRPSRIKPEAFNCMLPGTLRVTGEADTRALRDYLDLAFARAALLGAQVCVFGSGGARSVPDGFPAEEAWRQALGFLVLAGDTAQRYGLRVAIEPLRREECNLINFVSEATALAAIANHPCVGVLADTYHMTAVGEPYASLRLAGARLWHVHTANPRGRTYPAPGDGADYPALFQALNAMGYPGRVSVEGHCGQFESEARAALRALSDAREAAK